VGLWGSREYLFDLAGFDELHRTTQREAQRQGSVHFASSFLVPLALFFCSVHHAIGAVSISFSTSILIAVMAVALKYTKIQA
jgi:hypothetical protein